jgi:type II secretory pathway component GspD/PulD (secretin)
MRGRVPWLVAAAVLAVCAAPLWAQSQPSEDNMAQLDIGDGKVSFDVRGRTLAEVVERIRDKTKVNIILSKEAAEATVTLKVQDLYWLVALEEVAEKAECILERASPVLIKVYKP